MGYGERGRVLKHGLRFFLCVFLCALCDFAAAFSRFGNLEYGSMDIAPMRFPARTHGRNAHATRRLCGYIFLIHDAVWTDRIVRCHNRNRKNGPPSNPVSTPTGRGP